MNCPIATFAGKKYKNSELSLRYLNSSCSKRKLIVGRFNREGLHQLHKTVFVADKEEAAMWIAQIPQRKFVAVAWASTTSRIVKWERYICIHVAKYRAKPYAGNWNNIAYVCIGLCGACGAHVTIISDGDIAELWLLQIQTWCNRE